MELTHAADCAHQRILLQLYSFLFRTGWVTGMASCRQLGRHGWIQAGHHKVHTVILVLRPLWRGRVAAGSTPRRGHTHIDSTSDQVLKIYRSLSEKKDNIMRMMKQNRTKNVYFSFFNTLNWGEGELEIESLEWVQECQLVTGGELAMRGNRCQNIQYLRIPSSDLQFSVVELKQYLTYMVIGVGTFWEVGTRVFFVEE